MILKKKVKGSKIYKMEVFYHISVETPTGPEFYRPIYDEHEALEKWKEITNGKV